MKGLSSQRVRLPCDSARHSSAKRDAQNGDNSGHGQAIAAEPDRDHRCILCARMDVILDHHLQAECCVMDRNPSPEAIATRLWLGRGWISSSTAEGRPRLIALCWRCQRKASALSRG